MSDFALPGASAPEKGPSSPGSGLELLLLLPPTSRARNARPLGIRVPNLLSRRKPRPGSLSSPFRRRGKSLGPRPEKGREMRRGFMTYYYVVLPEGERNDPRSANSPLFRYRLASLSSLVLEARGSK